MFSDQNSEKAVREVAIRSIKPVGRKTVVNLSVEKNHTFITENGIAVHNCDKLSPHAQGMLRAEIERYSDSCRFIFCCNYPNKIIPALHSRLQEIKFVKLDEDDFILRAADVLVKENINFEPETLVEYKNRTYPDLRKCINLLQQNSRDGKLAPPREEDAATKDYLLDVVSLFKAGKYLEGRKLIIEQANPEEYDEVYRYFYQNLSLFGTTQSQQDEALLAIRKALVYDVTVADREVNLAAAIVELTQIATAGV